jgi:DnaK suppressor protein
MLEERRNEIHEKLRSLRETLPAEVVEVRDPEERSVADFVQEVDFALMEMKSATLAKIDEALRRLEEGVYGVCAECGQEISEARLAAVPFASMCRDCQEQWESEEREERVRLQHAEKPVLGELPMRR